MELISAVCEVHSQLRIANLYLKTKKHFTLTTAKIKSDHDLCLTNENEEIVLNFPPSIKLLTGYDVNLSLLEGSYVHIRMPCGVPKGETSGSENVEVLNFADLCTTPESSRKSLRSIFIPARQNSYRIECATCSNALVNAVQFERVLPMPRSAWSEAVSDWYCHRHGEDSTDQSLQPRPSDCLYGSCYYIFPAEVYTTGSLKSEHSKVTCENCQSTIGVIIEKSMSVWSHSLQWSTVDYGGLDTLKKLDVATPLESFYYALYDALTEEKSFFGRKIAFRDPTDDTCAVILWFVGDRCNTLKGSIEMDSSATEMRPASIRRVLYKQVEKSAKIPGDVCEYLASAKMIHAALNQLHESSEQLPTCMRNAAGFLIGYLEVGDWN